MTDFYTNVLTVGERVFVRGVENGVSFLRKEPFSPTLYVNSNKANTEWSSLYGDPIEEIKPGLISETRDFVKMYENVEGFSIYGNTNYKHQYISDTYQGEVKWDISQLRIYSLDIETTVDNGFPNPQKAEEEITLLSLMDKQTKNITTFGYKFWETDRTDVHYVHCTSESQLLKEFLTFWSYNYPDAVTGWNIDQFDIPYLVNRINNVLGEEYSKKLSPWSRLRERTFFEKGRQQQTYNIEGVAILDYLELYRKFTYTTQESYKLDHIAFVELGERKLENPGDTFKEFYESYWDTFVSYNIRDSELVDRLEDKMKLLELIITLAYMAKINYEEVFSPVGMWDAIIYNHLRDKKIAIPQKVFNGGNTKFEGAFVKEPIVGFHKYIASFDLASLYPHLMMNYNMSPETLSPLQLPCTVDELLYKKIDTSIVKENNLALTANGWCYRKDKKGFLPELMQKMYNDRSAFKKQMLKCEQEYEHNKTEELSKEISRLSNLQMALKIALNSCYGAVGNQHFRYFDLRIAEGITLSGQLSIRWVANRLNQYMNKVMGTTDEDYIIAIDTDSNYLSLEKLIEKTCAGKTEAQKIAFMDKICNDSIQPIINKCYEELADYMNAYEQKMQMKREVLADKGIFVAKKRYILNVHNSEGVQYAKPKLKVMGLEMVRSSTPAVIREKLKQSIEVILEGNQHNLQKFVKDFRSEFNNLPIEAIAKPSGINGMTTYSGSPIYVKGTPIHVRGALLFNHHIKRMGLGKKYPIIQDGDKIKFVYVEKPNPFHEDVIAFPGELPLEFNMGKYIDYDKQFEKVFLDAISIIINPIGWSLEETSTLDEFF